MISATTRVFGVIGDPITHSLSPRIHNFFAQHLGHDLVYTAFEVAADNLNVALAGAAALGIQGLNVTYPHKTAAMAAAVRLTDAAVTANAVNTLKLTADGYVGHNTDAVGVVNALASHKVDLAGQSVTILGAGAAARAAACAVAMMGCQKLVITNRSKNNANLLANFVEKYYNVDTVVRSLDAHQEGATLLINSLPIGVETTIHPDVFDIIFDMNYHPSETALTKAAKAAQKRTFNGLAMLVFQAAAAYEFFTDAPVPPNIINNIFMSLDKEGGR